MCNRVSFTLNNKKGENMNKNTPNCSFNNNWIQPVLKDLTKKVDWWIKKSSNNIFKTGEEIACEALTYSIKPGLLGNGPFPCDKEHLFRSAYRNAKYMFLNEIKKTKKATASFNDYKEDDEGEIRDVSFIEEQLAIEKYRATKKQKEQIELATLALKKLDSFLAKKNVSTRDIDIYKSWELYNVPTAIVTEKYKISTSNLHKIVCSVNKLISRYGRELLNAA
jgi:hypothetical protein